jgi:DNA-binding transcriptional ArsR family regulator
MTVADLPAIATLIGDRTRAAMLDALVEGDLPASELARRAGVSASTASAHLSKLVEGGIVAVERRGRQRRYRLAGAAVAAAIEALAAIAPRRQVSSLREATTGELLREARTCYDHLAGKLGVELTSALTRRRILRADGDSYFLTERGERALRGLGIDVDDLRRQRRAFAKPCLDWSERRHHVAGALGAALARRLFELGWLERAGSGRAVVLTAAGREGLRDLLGEHLGVPSAGVADQPVARR